MPGSIYFEHDKGTQCRDKRHRSCHGRWRGEYREGDYRKRVSGASKTEVQDQLDDIEDELAAGVNLKAAGQYMVRQAVADWIASLVDLAPKTIQTKHELTSPLMTQIGDKLLRDLEAEDVLNGLKAITEGRSSRTVRDARACLVSAITYAQARRLVGRNVAALVKNTPPGKSDRRPSRALTPEQANAVLNASSKDRLFPYIVLSLGLGIRTEEARALRWDHLDLAGDDKTPPHIDVWRSVRAGGDVKTKASRRTLALPGIAVRALDEHRDKQKAAGLWAFDGLVFVTRNGTALDAGNVRRSFKRICEAAGIGRDWTPRELRHSFVSIMSDRGVPLERIADMVGHAGGSSVTGRIYRQQLQPILVSGAEVMDTVG